MSEDLTYRAAGVDIDAAGRALRAVLPAIRETQGEAVIGGIGGFGALYDASFPGISRPLLVASVDGVGTKTKVAQMVGAYEGLGHDIVNHCVNDILCQGARPLFFLDYFGCSRLPGLVFEKILRGMSAACLENGCSLVGGETAEMPGVYVEDEFDVVGSIVGVVDADKKLPRGKVQPGDLVIGLASAGLHTNGFTLARRALFEMGGLSVRDAMPLGAEGETIGDALLRPHLSYLSAVLPLVEEGVVHAAAHVTGGGLYDNLPRVLPSDIRVLIDRGAWEVPPLFRLIQELGGVPQAEMYRAFNMGVGMVLFVPRAEAAEVARRCEAAGRPAAVIGELQAGASEVQIA